MADNWQVFDGDWPELTGRPIHKPYPYCGQPLPQPTPTTSASQQNNQHLQIPLFSDQFTPIQFPVSTEQSQPFQEQDIPIFQEQLFQHPLPVTPQHPEQFQQILTGVSSQHTVQFTPIPTTSFSQYAMQPTPAPAHFQSTGYYQPMLDFSEWYTAQQEIAHMPLPVDPNCHEHLRPIATIDLTEYPEYLEPISDSPQYEDTYNFLLQSASSPNEELHRSVPVPKMFPFSEPTPSITITCPRMYKEQYIPIPVSTENENLLEPSFPLPAEFQNPGPSTFAAPSQPLRYTFMRLPKPAPDNPNGETPRQLRNKTEKLRRDTLNHCIAELSTILPPVLAYHKKVDKTSVLRLTAHYLRANQHVFANALYRRGENELSYNAAMTLLHLMDGFLLAATYKGLIVVMSQNVNHYLGYNELELLGQNVFTIVHEEDHELLRVNFMPPPGSLGPNGELILPEDPEERARIVHRMSSDMRRFFIRFKKVTPRSEPVQYVTCHVEGSLRKADRACSNNNRCCSLRRVRARADNFCCSGNDVVFVGLVRPSAETFKTESQMEVFRNEYMTRHSVDGRILQVEQKISLVAGYMTYEVEGVNAMNFIHKDDVRWVIFALREMYDSHRLTGESCYRIMAKNGQLMYMKTRGTLEVDLSSRAVTTFICTNTVVDEVEGRFLINQMKKKLNMLINGDTAAPVILDDQDDGKLPVEDPKELEKVILDLVTDLPSPPPQYDNCSPNSHLAIIPPQREKIISAIEKSYSIITVFDKPPALIELERKAKIVDLTAPGPSNAYPNKNESKSKIPLQSFGHTFPNKAVNGERFNRNPSITKKSDHLLTTAQMGDPGLGASFQTAPKRPNDCDMTDGSHKKKMGGPAETYTHRTLLVDELFEGMNNILDNGDSQLENILTMHPYEPTNDQNEIEDILLQTALEDIFNNADLDNNQSTDK